MYIKAHSYDPLLPSWFGSEAVDGWQAAARNLQSQLWGDEVRIFRLAKYLSGTLHSQGDVTSASVRPCGCLGWEEDWGGRGHDPLWDGDEVKLTGWGLWVMRNVKQPEKELNRLLSADSCCIARNDPARFYAPTLTQRVLPCVPDPTVHIAAWHVWHVATVSTRVRLQTRATHVHTPSAAYFAMNSTSGRWFINPCSSSQRGRPCKGVCLFVLRETWWKKRWFIWDRMRKQMDRSWSIWLPVVMEYGLFLLTVLYVQVWCWLPIWASGPCHNNVPLFKMKRPLVDSMTMWHPK